MSDTQDRPTQDGYDDLLLAIVDALEAEGFDLESNRLYDFIDPDVLEKLLESATGPVTVTFTAGEYQVTVTPTTVIVSEQASTATGRN